MSVTAGIGANWLSSFAICGPNGHSLKSRVSTLDRIVDDEEVICRDLIQDHVIDPLKRVLRALTAAQRQTRADNATMPESLKTLLRDLAAEACDMVVFIERLCNETRLIQILHHDSIVKRMHMAHMDTQTFLRGVQQLRSEDKLPTGFESADLRPHADNDERLHIRFWRDLVHASCAQVVDNILQRAVVEPSSVAIRCAVQHEWRRQDRLDVLMPALRTHEHAVRQYLTAGNTRELERQLMQFFVPSFELVVRGYTVDGSDINDGSIGTGGYGKAYLGEYGSTMVVAKRLFAKLFKHDLLLNELLIWRGLRHSNVLRFMGVTSLDKKCWIVSEFASGGTLKSYLKCNTDKRLHLLHGTALGLAYLHAQGIVHADLRCDNILVGSDGQARVADFGLSFRVPDKIEVKRTEADQWRAPECIANQPRSFATDVYMFGMTIVEACFGGPPYENTDNTAIRKRTLQSMLPPSLDELRYKVQTLVRDMCAFEPADRITMTEVVARLGELTNEDCMCAKKNCDVVTSNVGQHCSVVTCTDE